MGPKIFSRSRSAASLRVWVLWEEEAGGGLAVEPLEKEGSSAGSSLSEEASEVLPVEEAGKEGLAEGFLLRELADLRSRLERLGVTRK